MEFVTLNSELKFPIPDGFHVMDEEEMSGMTMIAAGPGVCLKDPERHMVVSVGYKIAGLLTSKILSQKDIAEKSEGTIRQAMQPYHYRPDGAGKREICRLAADGFGYQYTAEEADMYAETYVIKKGKTFYYFHVYMRAALKEESMPVWEEMLREAVWL